jgi:hypothetical protein
MFTPLPLQLLLPVQTTVHVCAEAHSTVKLLPQLSLPLHSTRQLNPAGHWIVAESQLLLPPQVMTHVPGSLPLIVHGSGHIPLLGGLDIPHWMPPLEELELTLEELELTLEELALTLPVPPAPPIPPVPVAPPMPLEDETGIPPLPPCSVGPIGSNTLKSCVHAGTAQHKTPPNTRAQNETVWLFIVRD